MATNPPNRFNRLHLEPDPECEEWESASQQRTQFLEDQASSLLSYNDSPDLGFEVSANPYRGCEHGCAYCYARPTHEYLGFSAGLDFESRIVVKMRAPELLRKELSSPRWKPRVIAFSGVTDCYQPIEKRLGLTRACLEVLAECRHPVCLITKNRLITRDLDLLSRLAAHQAVGVWISLTTLDPDLQRVLEPRTSPPGSRLETIRQLAGAGVPVGVLVAPMIPALNEPEIPRLLQEAAGAGALAAGGTLLRLPLAVEGLFVDWLRSHQPARVDKVLNGIRRLRGGRLSDSRFESRMTGTGRPAVDLARWFEVARRRAGLATDLPPISAEAFRRPGPPGQGVFL